MSTYQEISPKSPAITVEFIPGAVEGRYRVTREGKGDHLEFSRTQLVRHGWAPVTGSSLQGPVTLWWDWRGGDDLAMFEDRRGRRSELASLSATVEELAFLYLS